jgi:hypothetical protein
MKTTILTAALMIVMTVANARTIAETNLISGSPEKTFQASVTKASPDMIRFNVQNPAQEKIVLKVYNDDNVKVYQKTVRKEKGINIGCDMSKAEKGTYTFIIKRNGKEEIKRSITL